MAVRKKTENEVIVEETPVIEENAPVVEEKPSAKKPTYNPTDIIECKSVTAGTLLCSGTKSGTLYRAFGYGDMIQVQYQDLLGLKLSKSSYLYMPRMIIEDETLLNDPMWSDLKAIAEEFYKHESLDEIFALAPARLKTVLSKASVGLKNAIKVEAATRVSNGSLDSMNRIKVLEECLGIDLQILM